MVGPNYLTILHYKICITPTFILRQKKNILNIRWLDLKTNTAFACFTFHFWTTKMYSNLWLSNSSAALMKSYTGKVNKKVDTSFFPSFQANGSKTNKKSQRWHHHLKKKKGFTCGGRSEMTSSARAGWHPTALRSYARSQGETAMWNLK